MSYFIFLALTQLSKVLKWTLLVLYLTFGVLKGIKFSLTFPTMSWGEMYFPSQTYPWSWKKSVYFCFWPNLCLECVQGSWKESTFVSVALYCLVYHQLGSWNEFPWCSFHCWLVSHLYEGSWNESQILQLCPLVGPLSTVFSVESVLADLWSEMTKLSDIIGCSVHMKGLEMTWNAFHMYTYQANQLCTQ